MDRDLVFKTLENVSRHGFEIWKSLRHGKIEKYGL
jgi:hypothetical protein